MKPAAYPVNNTEEYQAIVCLMGLIDPSRVKPDLNYWDKVPNHDGSVELVDPNQRPIGEIKVQVKKIPAGATKFDCPIELVAYSQRITNPFILIVVDVDNRRAYWRQISDVMPEAKLNQLTFVIHFKAVVDEIGLGFPYFDRWLALCDDFKRRISQFPKLESKINNEIGLAEMSSEERMFFQDFISEANAMLDVKLPLIKHEFFADAWKLGVSVHQADRGGVFFTIFTVPKGENAPLLIHKPRRESTPVLETGEGKKVEGVASVSIDGKDGPTVSTRWIRRDSIGNPTQEAQKSILRYMERLIREKRLHVHGAHYSAEVLLEFLKHYAHTFGLPEKDTYAVSELEYGLHVFMPVWYSASFLPTYREFKRIQGEKSSEMPFPSFELIANRANRGFQPPESHIRELIAAGFSSPRFPIVADSGRMASLPQAVDYLCAVDIMEIQRDARPRTKSGRMVWDAYSVDDLRFNFNQMVTRAGEDFPYFMRGNKLEQLNSTLLSGEDALIYITDTGKWKTLGEPSVFWARVKNPDRSLRLVTVVDLSEHPEAVLPARWGTAEAKHTLKGVERKYVSYGESNIMGCFAPRPIESTLYKWLNQEIANFYGDAFKKQNYGWGL